jgi:hypothetical protein
LGAAVAERLVKALDAVKATIGERFVDERPKMFGRLELWTVGGLKYEANAVWYGQVFWPVVHITAHLQDGKPLP